jgi:hypothetical protein
MLRIRGAYFCHAGIERRALLVAGHETVLYGLPKDMSEIQGEYSHRDFGQPIKTFGKRHKPLHSGWERTQF